MNANDLRALLARWADEMAQKRDWLIELDSVVGDSDLGLTMSDGFRAASDAANACDLTDVGKLCYQAGKAMASAVPSTMGTVSYTHLDVYKRQRLFCRRDRPLHRGDAGRRARHPA